MTPPTTPAPGACALDTAEAREAVTLAIVAEATRLDAEDWSADDHFTRSLADAALRALAPFVAAAQAAAWRAGVEAAAAVCDREADAAYGLAPLYVENDPLVAEGYYGRQEAAAECAREIRALPPPAAFAAPGPDGCRAKALRLAVEANAGGDVEVKGIDPAIVAACATIVIPSAQSRACWDKLRRGAEAQMIEIAEALPVASWVKTVKGFGLKNLAVIIGETGDLSGYATKERVWKRCGLAVINGERQQRKKGPAAFEHGFDPQRRAELWVFGNLGLFTKQWRAKTETEPGHPIGPYGEIYARRRAHTAPETHWDGDAHRHRDAVRIMTKAAVEDLWRVWNGKAPLYGAPGPRDPGGGEHG